MSDPNVAHQASEPIVEIFGCSPIFGIFKEGNARVLGRIRGNKHYHRVRFEGDKTEKIRPVFRELQGCLDPRRIKALNELIFLSASDAQKVFEDCVSLCGPSRRRRKITLPKRRR